MRMISRENACTKTQQLLAAKGTRPRSSHENAAFAFIPSLFSNKTEIAMRLLRTKLS